MSEVKVCAECKHAQKVNRVTYDEFSCRHPDNIDPHSEAYARYLVTGKEDDLTRVSCLMCRKDDSKCGRSGEWYEAKSAD